MRINFENLNLTEPTIQQDTKESIRVKISYPYNLQKSLSPLNYKKQLSVLKEKLALPESASKFIQNAIQQTKHIINVSNDLQDQSSKLINDVKKQIKMTAGLTIINQLLSCSKEKPPIKKTKTLNKQIKKHQCCNKINSETLRQYKQSLQCKYTPQIISYAKKIPKRNAQNIYSKLYQDYWKQKFKNQFITNQKKIVQTKLNISKKQTKNYIPFYERYNFQIQKLSKITQKTIHDSQYDWKTGLKLFTPNLNESKSSFQTFNSTINRIKHQEKKQKANPPKMKKKVVEDYHKNSFKRGQYDSISTSINKSVELKKNRQEKILDRLIQIFFDGNYFRKGVKQLSELSHNEFEILQPFLSSLQQYREVSRPLFKNLLYNFYKKITLYDRNVLANSFYQNRKINKFNPQQLENTLLTFHPLINDKSRSLSKEDDFHNRTISYF